MMKSRYRTPGKTPRSHKIPIGFNDEEYQLLIYAANSLGVSTSAFIAAIALREGERIAKMSGYKVKKGKKKTLDIEID